MQSLKTGAEQSVPECRECGYKVTAAVAGEPNGDSRNDQQPHLLTQSHPEDAISIAAAVEKAYKNSQIAFVYTPVYKPKINLIFLTILCSSE